MKEPPAALPPEALLILQKLNSYYRKRGSLFKSDLFHRNLFNNLLYIHISLMIRESKMGND